MKRDEAKLLREIQRNARMGMKAIDALNGKVDDDDMALQLARQAVKYSEIQNRAADKMIEGRVEPYRENAVEDMMLIGGIHTNTLFNTSTSHIAELVIQGSNRGLTEMWKAMNGTNVSAGFGVELAKELMDFEEKNIEQLKKYL